MKGKKLLLLLSDHLFECFCVNTSKLKQIASKHAKKCIKCNLIKRHILHCWEPAREIPPMTRSCGRELLSKASGLEVFPRPAQASAPKPESLSYYFVPFTNSPDINRGLSPTTFLWRKST